MNILVIARSTHFHFKSGGLETQLKNFTEGLVKKGYGVTVLTTYLPNKETYSEKGVNYVFIQNTTPGYYPYSYWQKLLLFTGLLVKRVKTEGTKNFFIESKGYCDKNIDKFDIIVSQSTAGRLVFTNKPMISIIHGTILAELKNRFSNNKTVFNWSRFIVMDLPELLFEKYTTNHKFFGRMSKIIAVSEMLKKQFLDEYPELKDKTEVIYNGVDSDKFKPASPKYQNFTLLYVGRMVREKGIDIILKSLKILIDRNVKVNLKLVGDGIHIAEFRKYVEENNLIDTVEFISELDNNKVVEYYQKSHLFVFPSRRQEGHPVTISEAYCSGLPVIASRNGGLNELIEENVTGYHLDTLDPIELANKIEVLYKDQNLLANLSAKTYKIGKEKYSQFAMIESYDKLIKSLVK